jgi:hypothetical protein
MDKPATEESIPKDQTPKPGPQSATPTPAPPSTGSQPTFAWWLVLALVGLDYFSTLAYLPSIAVTGSGFDFAALTAVLVAAFTLLAALPIYLYVAGRSPHGLGATGLLESHFRGWSSKIFILLLLGFIATDFVVTRTLSAADASTHLIENSYWRSSSDWIPRAKESLYRSVPPVLQGATIDTMFDWWNEQVTVTVILSVLAFGLYFFLLRGFTRGFLYAAGVIVGLFVLLNGTVIVSSLVYLSHHPDYVTHWKLFHDISTDKDPISLVAAVTFNAVRYAPPSAFNLLALGLSGFELSMASIGLVRGRPGDDPAQPRGRIRNARKLLVAAALLMSLFVLGSVLSVRLLVPTKAMNEDGPARNRALAYLAHGGRLQHPERDPNAPPGDRPEDDQVVPADPPAPAAEANDAEPKLEPRASPTAADINPLFGPIFGTIYDISAILILFLAGASVTISLRNLLPHYLTRYGMEMHWARRRGLLMHLFNLVILVVILHFHASVTQQLGAYAASVYVLLTSAAVAALVDLRARWKRAIFLPLLTAPLILVCAFFLLMAAVVVWHSPAGAVIALLFIVLVLVTAGLSRWIRGTELRYSGFTFADEESGVRWEQIRRLEFRVLVPHRPGLRSLAEKEAEIRAHHRLAADVPIIYIEAELGDPSDFQQYPLLRIVQEDGREVIRVSECASIAHVLAAIALEFREVGRPPEMHFGWSLESPLASNLSFLLFGEGNVPWMVRDLIRKAEPNPARQPRVVIG